jgi:hypothetical protein
MHIFIATPMFGGMCFGRYTLSLLGLQKFLISNGVDSSYEFLFNDCYITMARNRLVHRFMQSKATHLLFIDADIKFNPEDVLSMIAADKDLICGVYSKKQIDWDLLKNAAKNDIPAEQLKYYTGNLVGNLLDEAATVLNINEPVEIAHAGTGFMLIKRTVFEKLQDKVPSYRSNYIGEEEFHKDYFALSIDPKNQCYFGEDYHFCQLWRQHGGKIYAAPWVRLSHIGSYEYSGCVI